MYKRLLATYIASVLVLLTLVACQGNPLAEAETLEQRVFAAYGTFVIFQEQAADLVEEQQIPESMQRRLVEANRRAAPLAESLLQAYEEYIDIRDELGSVGSNSERVVLAASEVENWLDQLEPVIQDLRVNVRSL